VRIFVDVAVGEALMGKSIEAAKALWEAMATNNYHLSSERAISKNSAVKFNMDAMTYLAGKMDA